jgi:outer membrane protein insertion porin family
MADVAFGQQPVRVVILPFEVHAQEDLSYLEQQIPEVIKNQLQQEGARVLVLDQETMASRQMRTESTAAIRQIVVDTDGNFIIWGSLTRLGPNFSLDVKLLASDEEEDP